MSAIVCPVGHTALPRNVLVICWSCAGMCVCTAQLFSVRGDRLELPSESIGSSTGRTLRRERPGGRGRWGAACGAGRARGGRGAPSHLPRKGKTVALLLYHPGSWVGVLAIAR